MAQGTPHEYSPELAKRVEIMAGLGLTQPEIAAVENVSLSTIKRHYKTAYHIGKPKAKLAVAQQAYKLATSGKCPAMTMFWLKTQAGWREVNRTELTGKDGKPIQQSNTANMVFETQWRALPDEPKSGS